MRIEIAFCNVSTQVIAALRFEDVTPILYRNKILSHKIIHTFVTIDFIRHFVYINTPLFVYSK
jgi:hypothetical protein